MAAVEKRQRVVIIGGSLGGLCTALVLKTLPQIESIVILERHEEDQLRDQGAGIRVGNEWIELLSSYAGVPPESYAYAQDRYVGVDEDGTELTSKKLKIYTSSWIQLLRVLTQHVNEVGSICSYRHGCLVTNVAERDAGVEVDFQTSQGRVEHVVADLVVAADGASSRIRQMFLPETERSYAGYVILRGLVPLEELSPPAQDLLGAAACLIFNSNSSAITYTVPGSGDMISDAAKHLNWGWYSNRTEAELEDLMMDREGLAHPFTLPMGMMRSENVEKLQAAARSSLPAPFAEAVVKSARPFVQVITDYLAAQNYFLGGKLVLVGDAVGGQRPHTATATAQCAYHAIVLRTYLEGRISIRDWSERTLRLSAILSHAGRDLGDISQSVQSGKGEKFSAFVERQAKAYVDLTAEWRGFKTQFLPN